MLQEPITLFAIYIACIFIGIIITRYIFSIPTLVKNSKAQTAILAEMARKQGVDQNIVDYLTGNTK